MTVPGRDFSDCAKCAAIRMPTRRLSAGALKKYVLPWMAASVCGADDTKAARTALLPEPAGSTISTASFPGVDASNGSVTCNRASLYCRSFCRASPAGCCVAHAVNVSPHCCRMVSRMLPAAVSAAARRASSAFQVASAAATARSEIL